MSDNKEEKTIVETVDINVDELLALPGADSVMVPGEEKEDKKPSFFSKAVPDMKFLDKPDNNQDLNKDGGGDDSDKKNDLSKKKDDDVSFLNPETDKDPDSESDHLDNDDKDKGGRPSNLISATKSLIEKGILTPFVNDKGEDEPVDKYTAEDFQELIEANIKNREDKMSDEIAQTFFKGLPEEFQQAYMYFENGGTDVKGILSALSATKEIKDLDISSEAGQKYAIRAYLQVNNWGTAEEIEDEINSLEDKGELEKKANQFKPKLDAMQQEIVNRKITEQDNANKKRQEQSQKYIDSVYSTLESGKLGEVEIDNKIQNMLYTGLTQPNYPSISGKQTNMLGHLLEKYQWVEPNHGLVAEALWLLADPDGYRQSVGGKVTKEINEKTLRTLKTEQSTKSNGTINDGEDGNGKINQRKRKNTMQRPKKNFFAR